MHSENQLERVGAHMVLLLYWFKMGSMNKKPTQKNMDR